MRVSLLGLVVLLCAMLVTAKSRTSGGRSGGGRYGGDKKDGRPDGGGSPGSNNCGRNTIDFRTIDGTCNNPNNVQLGSVGTAYRRIMPAQYEGDQNPIGSDTTKTYYGHAKPSPRVVGNIIKASDQFTTDLVRSALFTYHGQFLAHDLALTARAKATCSGCQSSPDCFPIPIPEGDPRYTSKCVDFTRSARIPTSNGFNQFSNLTHWIDANNIYGSFRGINEKVRDSDTPHKLREGERVAKEKCLLPTDDWDLMECATNLTSGVTPKCFLAGDVRVNENLGLATVHTIWMREHNRVAKELKKINKRWDDERVYQQTKKIVTAEWSEVTFYEWLPLLIGSAAAADVRQYKGYNSSVDPRVTSAFSTAAFRLHVALNPMLHRLTPKLQEVTEGHIPIHKAAFAPQLMTEAGGLDALLRGMAFTPAKAVTPSKVISDELTERLFKHAVAIAGDLASFNIQRGRDHALPGYLEWRRHFGLPASGDGTTCGDMSAAGAMDDGVCNQLTQIYGHLGNVDLWVGGLMETVSDDALVGDTFKAIIKDTFLNLRNGDRFWYEDPEQFNTKQLREIKKARISRIVCDNGNDVKKFSLQGFKYHQNSFQDPTPKPCGKIPRVNLKVWKEKK